MNLTDLQVELRGIEEHISQLHTEIEKMKPKTDEDKKSDFDSITKLAKKYPIGGLVISSAPEVTQKKFIMSLANLLIAEEKDLYSRLLYITRISYGCNLQLAAEDIYKAGLEYELKDIEELCKELQDYKHDYVITALIIANISGEVSNAMLSVIADMAKIFGFANEEIRVLALIAKGVLIENMDIIDDMPLPSKNMWSGKLRDYLSTEWIQTRRIQCVSICTERNENNTTSNPCLVLERPYAGIVVRKGDVILVYEEKVKNELQKTRGRYFTQMFVGFPVLDNEFNVTKEKRTVTAPCDGILFFVEKKKDGDIKGTPDKYLEAYVVSYFDDYKEFCEWHKIQN